MLDHESQAPILALKDTQAPSVFEPANLLREARRQRELDHAEVPELCLLDPDGDIVRFLKSTGRAERVSHWACYHSQMWRFTWDGQEFGIVGCAVGAPYAVLVAEQMFASGCRFLISITSSGQIAPLDASPCFILIEQALRDEGTSYHYLPPSRHVEADARVLERLAFLNDVRRGTTWTTDAPYRETEEAIAAHRKEGILAVEMEAAALYAFSKARNCPLVCFAHVTNQMAQSGDDFEKGDDGGAIEALSLASAAAKAWMN
ncbi:Purine or other phosphorylase family 1 [Rhodospirillaceae bacterium LM-1]|nr:Purine or other phosphorylase family 1 [Rhodospirillaceae bacterium LM-1]